MKAPTSSMRPATDVSPDVPLENSDEKVIAEPDATETSASFAGHYAGAQRYAAVQWNSIPTEVDAERVWDWSDPQFLAWTRRTRGK